MSKFRSRLYAVLAALYFLGGVCFDVLVMGSLLSYEPINPFDELLNKDENSLLYLVGFFVALFFLGALIYTASLDPFRSERPWGLVYLNFLPVSFYMGVVFIPLVFAERNITHPIQAGS
ncbi:hypothetical protein HYR69_00940, partial [Candidatus Sumerlaeota bacterium]|nr:hypothetical protein [Candidatus Sumerlaeota bacterium]